MLIAHDYRSLFQYEQYRHEQHQASDPLNSLLEAFGLRMKRLLSYPPEEITDLHPHYLTSSVDRLFVREPIYLDILKTLPKRMKGSPPQVVARLPWSKQPFVVAAEVEYGRVVAIADYAPFTDEYISYGNNQQLALNIFRWLSSQHHIDCFDARMQSVVFQEQTADFSIVLHNPQPQRLEHIHCLLESDKGVEILESQKVIRSIAPYGKIQLHWAVKPSQLGNQILRLTVDFPENLNVESLFFDKAARFQCLPDAEIDLVIRNSQGENIHEVETGQTFEVQAVFRKTATMDADSLRLQLKTASSHLLVESTEDTSACRWRLNALSEGNSAVTLVVKETDQQVSLPIRVHSSTKEQIASLEKNVMGPIAAELQYRTAQIHPGFDSQEMQQIPCHIHSPENFISLLKAPSESEQLLEALQVAREERNENRPLVLYLLQNIAPTFSPIHGCCIPYDPKLATHLSSQHAQYKDNLAQNFLTLEDKDRTWIEQSLAALILHEKYGHGFFFTQTTLGRQLSILYKHGMTRNADPLQLKAPYPRAIYQEYKQAIAALWDSAVIVNEGFATWVELAVLPSCSGVISEAAYRRKDFLFNQDSSLSAFSRNSEYFQHFTPLSLSGSRYQEGCEYFQLIQGYFEEDCGARCAVHALIKAADIDMGVSENNGQVQFALNSKTMTDLLLSTSDHSARADMRIRLIHGILRDFYNKIRLEQKKLMFNEIVSRCEHPVDVLVNRHLGW